MVAFSPLSSASPRRRVASAIAGGVLAALSLPPWGWWPLGIVGLAVYAVALTAGDGAARGRLLVGAAFGLGLFGPGLWWVTEFHAVGFFLLLAAQTGYLVAAAWATTRLEVFPAAIVVAEAIRGAVPFGGLPLGGLALGQAGGPLVASARVGGALLVLGVAALAAAALAGFVLGRRPRPAIGCAIAAVVVAATGWVAPEGSPTGRELDTALVQGGGRRGFRAVESDPGDVFDAHLRASDELAGPLDLVVWPENGIDVVDITTSVEAQDVGAIARRLSATLVAGVTQDVDGGGFENVAVVWDADGEIVDRYVKAHRVPFGEYVPMRDLIDDLVDLSVLPRDAVAGTGEAAVTTPVGKLGVAISYEVFFADRARSAARSGGQVLLVPTNAASFTTSQVPTQEVAAARLRAWETGRWVLQAAPTGYTAVIDHRGRVLSRSTLGRREVLTAEVPMRSGSTIYTRTGDWPLLAIAVTTLLFGFWARKNSHLWH